MALKLAGELGDEAPPQLAAVCAVSPTLDLAVCVDALERRANYPYQFNFVRNLKARMRRKAALFPDDFSVAPLGRIWTVRQFDEAYTAPYHGFADATDYYHRASAMRAIDRIRVPTLILTAENDPFVPPDPFRDPTVTGNPHITTVVTREGGHCAFVEHSDGRLRRLLGGARGRQVCGRGGTSRRPRRPIEYWPSEADAGLAFEAKPRQERLPELRTFPCLFVLEVDEHVLAA